MNPSKKSDPEPVASPDERLTTDELAPEGAGDSAGLIADFEKRIQEAEGRALRVQAELENFRRRTRREMDDQLKFASLPLIHDLIEVVDNLSRALSAAETESGQPLVEGVRMVQNQLEQLLEKNGCQRIAAVNQLFDPHLHAALEMRPSEEVPANVVIAETRSGFRMHDRVVRPAQVVVSTGPAR